jgi:hypothetical protein
MQEMEVRHYLTFEFTGRDEKFVYVVTEETKEGVTQDLLYQDEEIEGSVIEFEDINGRKISINRTFLRRCQAVYDAGGDPDKGEGDYKPDMIIIMEGMREPLEYLDIEPEDAALIASLVADIGLDEIGFASFVDEDGEDNLIAIDSVMLLDTLHYEDEFDEEDGAELDENPPAEVEPQPRRRKPRAARAKKPAADSPK